MSKTNAAQLLALLEKQAPYDREEMLRRMLEYGQTDLLCYRAPFPPLRKKQEAVFDPVLGWALKEHKLSFQVTEGITPVAQPKESLAKLRALFEAADDRELAALSLLVPLLGSALLALALWKKQVTVEEAIKATHLDEDFQAEQWGKDEDAAALWAGKVKDIHAATEFLNK